jgi:hypothetical protein
VSYAVFFAGLVISAVLFYRGRPLDPKAAILSDLESPDDNPHGYAPAAAGTALCGMLLAPAVPMFYRRLRSERPRLAMAGAAMLALGLGAAVAIGVLAPFTRGYTTLHVNLAFLAFLGICGGTLCNLLAARRLPILAALQGVALLFLLFLYFGPDVLTNDTLLRSLGFWEWALCLDCGIALSALAAVVSPNLPAASDTSAAPRTKSPTS